MFTLESCCVNEKLQLEFEKVFARTEEIFTLVSPSAYYDRPIPLRHPINFYEGHLAAFLWNTLFGKILGATSIKPKFDRLFERGIDPIDQQAANAKNISQWPSREETVEYKRTIHNRFFEFLSEVNLDSETHPLLKNGYGLWLTLEHEMMHQETLLYMLHQLPHPLKIQNNTMPETTPKTDNLISGKATNKIEMINIPAGKTILGAAPNEFDFVWDNEQPHRIVDIDRFSMDVFNVTNGQFLEFVEAGGYQRPEFWTPETWQWKNVQKKEHPFFWKKTDAGWQLKNFFSTHTLPLSWPVYVTHAEAVAYARFIGKRLPTEAEWHRAAFADQAITHPWGNAPTTVEHGNFDFHHWSPVPVGQTPKGASVFGIQDMVGNGWEWTSTPFYGFPGFQASVAYPPYSTDFFDGQHFVVKGASCFTDACLLRRSFRNWYYWHYPYMYATFRCVQ